MLRDHHDADVIRFAVAQRCAREHLARPEQAHGARVVRRGKWEIVHGGSAARYGADAARVTATPRSRARG